MKRVTIAVVIAVVSLFATTSFAAKEKPLKGANLLIELETNFASDVAKNGHAAFLTYFAEDGVELVEGGGIDTKDDMRKQPPWPEGTSLTWKPVFADMAASGDLGYTYGTFEFHSKNKDGKPAVDYGKYTSIWKLQKDGSWKVVLDMGNASPNPKA
jgi:ketosteroid isomerase-like protein